MSWQQLDGDEYIDVAGFSDDDEAATAAAAASSAPPLLAVPAIPTSLLDVASGTRGPTPALRQIGSGNDGYVSRGSSHTSMASECPARAARHSALSSIPPGSDSEAAQSEAGPRPRSVSDTRKFTAVDLLQTPADHVAKQITLLDFAAFKKIQEPELRGCAWTKKDKFAAAPNVVDFTRRFNHLSFWVTREVLHAGTLNERALLLGYFVKLAKQLKEHNNLHGALAVVSALRSAPIHRLTKTWQRIKTKRSDQYLSIRNFLSEQDNYNLLRDHVKLAKLPCIPYLGIYLTDLVHLHTAAGDDKSVKQAETEQIIQDMMKFKGSQYDYAEDPDVTEYLLSINYKDELTKMIEDEHYRLSLQLQPRLDTATLDRGRLKKVARDGDMTDVGFDGKSLPYRIKKDFKKGHRKARSLGTPSQFWQQFAPSGGDVGATSLLGDRDARAGDAGIGGGNARPYSMALGGGGGLRKTRTHEPVSNSLLAVPRPFSANLSMSTDDLVSASNCFDETSDDSEQSSDDEAADVVGPHLGSIAAVDRFGNDSSNSLADRPPVALTDRDLRRGQSSDGSVLSTDSLGMSAQDQAHGPGGEAPPFDIEGSLLRKRTGRLSSYKRYWVALSKQQLVLYSRKHKGVTDRGAFSSRPTSTYNIDGAQLSMGDTDLDRKFAILLRKGKTILLKADSAQARGGWIGMLAAVLDMDVGNVGKLKAPRTPMFHRRKMRHPSMSPSPSPMAILPSSPTAKRRSHKGSSPLALPGESRPSPLSSPGTPGTLRKMRHESDSSGTVTVVCGSDTRTTPDQRRSKPTTPDADWRPGRPLSAGAAMLPRKPSASETTARHPRAVANGTADGDAPHVPHPDRPRSPRVNRDKVERSENIVNMIQVTRHTPVSPEDEALGFEPGDPEPGEDPFGVTTPNRVSDASQGAPAGYDADSSSMDGGLAESMSWAGYEADTSREPSMDIGLALALSSASVNSAKILVTEEEGSEGNK